PIPVPDCIRLKAGQFFSFCDTYKPSIFSYMDKYINAGNYSQDLKIQKAMADSRLSSYLESSASLSKASLLYFV
ncbi:hypothetical protein, partial [Enterocloster hominis (ex Hitch et al. 2024)]